MLFSKLETDPTLTDNSTYFNYPVYKIKEWECHFVHMFNIHTQIQHSTGSITLLTSDQNVYDMSRAHSHKHSPCSLRTWLYFKTYSSPLLSPKIQKWVGFQTINSLGWKVIRVPDRARSNAATDWIQVPVVLGIFYFFCTAQAPLKTQMNLSFMFSSVT